MERALVTEVLDFWFKELKPQDWFKKSENIDQEITRRFLRSWEKVKLETVEEHTAEAKQALASIIVLDQFPRNMFRGEPTAFSTDAMALATSQKSIEKGYPEELSIPERVFLFMPFQHSEDARVQETSVELFKALGENENYRFALEHKKIIDRFGRFPHRNRALDRESTPEELDFLKRHSGF